MSGRVFIISSVYGGNSENERKNNKRLIEWRFDEDTEKEFENLGYSKFSIPPPFIASRDDKFELISAEGNRLPYSRMVAKGCAVRNKMINIVKNNEPFDDEDIILYLDGDGQIPLNQLYVLVKHLKNNDFVVSCRAHNFGIDDDRKKVELFENFLISEKYSVDLPDAQCGCWGFKAKHLPKLILELSAEGFEIELDLMLYFLKNNIIPKYTYIDVSPPKISSTYQAREDDLKKLLFLMGELRWDNKTVLELYLKFEKRGIKLPQEYKKYFSNLDFLTYKIPEAESQIKLNCKKNQIECCLDRDLRKKLPAWHPCKHE